MSKRSTGDLRSNVRRLMGAKLEVIWVRALANRATRAAAAAGVGEPVSHFSVGSDTFSWAMVAALATTGRTAAPKTERAAAERKALREVGSAFMTIELLWT